MLSAIAPAPAVARSSLEKMLDSIRQRDEQPKDVPPALPARPVKRGRLPSARRCWPVDSGVGVNQMVYLPVDGVRRKEKASLERSPVQNKEAVFRSGIFGSRRRRLSRDDEPGDSPYAMVPEGSTEVGCEQARGSNSTYARSSSSDHFGGSGCNINTSGNVLEEIAVLEDARSRLLQAVLDVQKCFRGFQARCAFKKLKNASTTMQAFVRGQKARNDLEVVKKQLEAAISIQKHVKRWVARKRLTEWRKATIVLQSVFRSWLARKHTTIVMDLEPSAAQHKGKPNEIYGQFKDTNLDDSLFQNSSLVELQTRLLKMEAALHLKEEENLYLREQLRHYEIRWSEYEAKMKAMEEVWQKQLTSLQVSLAAARRSFASDDAAGQPGKPHALPPLHIYGPQHTSVGILMSEATPKICPPSNINPLGDVNVNGVRNSVAHLTKELEQRKQVPEDDARFIVDVKAGQSDGGVIPHEALPQLKLRFAIWKKDCKQKLRETKMALQKLGNADKEKKKRKWWDQIFARGK